MNKELRLKMLIEAQNNASKDIKNVQNDLKMIADEIKKVQSDANKSSRSLQDMGKSATKAGKSLTTKLTLPLALVGAGMAKSAMDLEATEAKYKTVFAGMTDEADSFIKEFQKLTPATTAEARSMASGIQDLLIPMGFVREEAGNMTGEFMHVAGALTNFNSATHSAQDVTNALQSALTGSTEPLKRLGVQLDVQTMKQKAVEMGLIGVNEEMSKQVRAQVVLAEVYAQSTDALDAYTEENLDALTKMGLLKAEAVDLGAKIGTILLPIITKAIGVIRGLVERFGSLSQPQQEFILKIGLVAGAIGPALLAFGGIVSILGKVKVALTALSGPIGIAILAITALYLAWENNLFGIQEVTETIWNAVKENFKLVKDSIVEFIDNVKNIFNDLKKSLKESFDGMNDSTREQLLVLQLVISTTWDVIKEMFSIALSVILDAVKSAFSIILDVTENGLNFIGGVITVGLQLISGDWSGAWETMKDVFSNIWDNIKDIAITSIDFVINSINTLIRAINKFTGSSIGEITTIGERAKLEAQSVQKAGVEARSIRDVIAEASGQKAMGGQVVGGRSYLVGERGAEMFTPLSSGTITPNDKLQSSINIQGNLIGNVTVQNEADEDRLIQKIENILTRKIQLNSIGSV